MKSPLALNWCIIWCSGCQVIWMSPYNKIIYLLTDYKPFVSLNISQEKRPPERMRSKTATHTQKNWRYGDGKCIVRIIFMLNPTYILSECELCVNGLEIMLEFHGNRNESFWIDKIFHIFCMRVKTKSGDGDSNQRRQNIELRERERTAVKIAQAGWRGGIEKRAKCRINE